MIFRKGELRGWQRAMCCLFTTWFLFNCATNSTNAQINVLTYHNDLARTGLNDHETELTPANVHTNSFGKLFAYSVDGQIYAQPLYVSALSIPGRGTRNVVFVATQHNSVYAFDADTDEEPVGGLIWKSNLGPSALTPNDDFGNRYGPFSAISPEVGITSTPTIDLASGTLYVDAFSHEAGQYFHKLHALNILDGTERKNSPVTVTASFPGAGVGSINGAVFFEAKQHLQRTALTLLNGVVYAAYAGYGDTDPYHGWIVGFDSTSLRQLRNFTFNVTPNSSTALYGDNAGEGGIWMSGCGLAADDQSNLYFEVGNGTFTADQPGGTEYGDTFLKLTASTLGLSVSSFFAPYNQAQLAAGDVDLGSGGAMLLPDSDGSPAHPHLLVGCGKEGTIYVLDRDNLGGFNPLDNHQIVQELPSAIGPSFGTPAYFNHRIYYRGVDDVMKAFTLSSGQLVTIPSDRTLKPFRYPGSTPTISANQNSNAIVWELETTAFIGGSAVLHAYDAENLTHELYNSAQSGTRDDAGGAVKFTVPTIANGKVYVGGRASLTVFGNGNFLAVPTITPTRRSFTDSVRVTLSVSTLDAEIHYTVDGSVPTVDSALYVSPFIITNVTKVQAKAFKAGCIPSPLSVALYQPIRGGYESSVLQANPVAYWRLNEAISGPAYDSANGNDGNYDAASLPGQPGPQSPVFAGFEPNNSAVQCTGLTPNSDVIVPPLNLNANTVTLTAWVYPYTMLADYTGLLVTFDNPQAGMTLTTGGQLGYTWNYDTAWEYQSGLQIPTNQWSFVAVAVEPSLAKLYLINTNGIRCATNYVSHVNEGWKSPAQIGDGGGDPTRSFNGLIDEVAVFDRTLFTGEINTLYRASLGLPTPPSIEINLPPMRTLYSTLSATLKVGVSGSWPMSFQWRKGGIPIIDDGRITGSSSGTLSITHVAPSDAGDYQLIVSNIAGTTSTSLCKATVQDLPSEAYPVAVLARNPVAYWRLNEDGTSSAEEATGSFAAQYGNASLLAKVGPESPFFIGFGQTNSAVAIGGDQSWITTPSLHLNTNYITLVAWVYPYTIQQDYTGLFYCRNREDASGFGFSTGNQLGYAWNVNDPLTWGFASGLSLPTNQWSFTALVIEPQQATLYMSSSNRVLSSINPIEHQKESFAVPSWIGDGSGAVGTEFNGMIDEVAIFNYAMAPEQIQMLYDIARLPRLEFQTSEGSLVLSWPKGTLLSAESLAGPWLPVPSADSPYLVPNKQRSSFFRLLVENQ